MVFCKCNNSYDVRCCCELNCKSKNSNKQFYNCPMKLSTIYFTLGNDYDLYNKVNNGDWNYIKKYFKLNKNELNYIKKEWLYENII